MSDNDTATEQRWWNEDTTLKEIARRYAEGCKLIPENVERFVAYLQEHGYDGQTLKQLADRHGLDVESVYEFHANEALWGSEANYYTVEQVARHALKHLCFDGSEPGGFKPNAFFTVQTDLKWLIQHCADDVRLCALQAAKQALDRLMSDEFCAVLSGIAGIKTGFGLNSSHLESTQPSMPDLWAWGDDN